VSDLQLPIFVILNNMVKLLISIVVCQLAGLIGDFFTNQSVLTWYPLLNKPFFNPPTWIFAPVWIILYFLMGIALFLVWIKKTDVCAVKKGLVIFFIQLGLNCLWSVVFFGVRSVWGGVLVISFLWISILWTMINFRGISRLAVILFIPYILWVSFAVVLNLSIAFLN
jgi:translocator protein